MHHSRGCPVVSPDHTPYPVNGGLGVCESKHAIHLHMALALGNLPGDEKEEARQ